MRKLTIIQLADMGVSQNRGAPKMVWFITKYSTAPQPPRGGHRTRG